MYGQPHGPSFGVDVPFCHPEGVPSIAAVEAIDNCPSQVPSKAVQVRVPDRTGKGSAYPQCANASIGAGVGLCTSVVATMSGGFASSQPSHPKSHPNSVGRIQRRKDSIPAGRHLNRGNEATTAIGDLNAPPAGQNVSHSASVGAGEGGGQPDSGIGGDIGLDDVASQDECNVRGSGRGSDTHVGGDVGASDDDIVRRSSPMGMPDDGVGALRKGGAKHLVGSNKVAKQQGSQVSGSKRLGNIGNIVSAGGGMSGQGNEATLDAAANSSGCTDGGAGTAGTMSNPVRAETLGRRKRSVQTARKQSVHTITIVMRDQSHARSVEGYIVSANQKPVLSMQRFNIGNQQPVSDGGIDENEARLAAAILEPGAFAGVDVGDNYVATRRLLLQRKAISGHLQRQKWKCNGLGYAAYRNYIRQYKHWASQNSGDLLSDCVSLSGSARWSDGSATPPPSRGSKDSTPGRAALRHIAANLSFRGPGSFGSSVGEASGRHVPDSLNLCLRIHHIFDESTSQVTMVKFGNLSEDLLAYASASGVLTIVTVGENPGILFHTGRVVQRAGRLESSITAMDTDHTGSVVFAGDSVGNVQSFSCNPHTGALVHKHRCSAGTKHKAQVNSVAYRTFSVLAGNPVLLVATMDGNLRFYSVLLELEGYLSLQCSIQLHPRIHRIRAAFCPILSLERGELIVTGNEDSCINFYDFTRQSRPCVNKVQGHRAPVIDCAWNHGETMLATSDSGGLVIIWKHVKF
ncbi:hypothetical protein CBR_g20107 [Chara braunii]|uniref:Uncharacterized protein n=1 Tax=Chara braunii TaxID=69332 RepID=A0A388KZJ6_CHABU|nr:hypothetical protein CBR_g20107 [Chara braunii]|eukprot:GBG75476.1 hypothetical protein CBR_g20107 [Chara braunii]